MGKITNFTDFKNKKDKKENSEYNLDEMIYIERERLAKGKITKEEYNAWEREAIWDYLFDAAIHNKLDCQKKSEDQSE